MASYRIILTEDFNPKKFTFEWINGTANSFLNGLDKNSHYNLIEMVGLLDYFDDEKIKQTMMSIYNVLYDGGVLVTANIAPNSEQKFVTNVVGWSMIYRQPEEFLKLVASVPFGKVIKQVEPLGVHTVVTAIK